MKPYYSPGITLFCSGDDWSGEVQFQGHGFGDDADQPLTMQGKLETRYLVYDGKTRTALTAVIDDLRAAADTMGIGFEFPGISPSLFYEKDGEPPAAPPQDWKARLAAEAVRIGWTTPYKED